MDKSSTFNIKSQGDQEDVSLLNQQESKKNMEDKSIVATSSCFIEIPSSQIQKDHLLSQEQQMQQIESSSQPFSIYMQTPFILRALMIDMLKLLLKAARDSKFFKSLTVANLPELPPQQQITHNYQKFQTNLDRKLEEARKNNRILNAQDMLNVFVKTFSKQLTVTIILTCLSYMCLFGSSLLIKQLISYIQNNGVNQTALLIAGSLITLNILWVLFHHNNLRLNAMVQSNFRNIFMKVLYKKVSSLSAFSVKEANVGKLINLISNDLQTLEQRFNAIFFLLSVPLPLIASTSYLYIKYGFAGLFGFGLLIITYPILLFLSKLNQKFFSDKSKYTDQRINLTKEIIEGVRLIKMYAWEEAFFHSMNVVRKLELMNILKITIITVLNFCIGHTFSIFGTYFILYFMFNYGESGAVDTALLFTTLNILNFTKNQALNVLSIGVSNILQLKVIINRMISVLVLKEKSMTKIEDEGEENAQTKLCQLQNGSVIFQNFTGYWKENIAVLNDINLEINKGELVCIVGQVGSGKTSLLNCLLKEIPIYKGYFNFSGNLAYVEQEPYIFSNTVKENILFGREYNEELYQNVIKASCLEQDITKFEFGDQTHIGERGVNISGGQKARISLARALYSQADIYLFDDPLSAVDSKVAKTIFFEAIKAFCKDSTVILVTHQIHFSRFASKIVILDQGRIVQQGTYAELEQTLQNLSSELHHNDHKLTEKSEENANKSEKLYQTQQINDETNKIVNNCQPQKEVVPKEEDVVVNLQTYFGFFKESGIIFVMPLIIVFYIFSHVVYVQFNKALGEFDESENKQELIHRIGYIVLIYIFAQLIKNISLCFAINKLCNKLLHKMVLSLLRSKVLFFDVTPSGRILQRFSSDIGQIDENLALILADIFEIFIGIIVNFTTIILITPYFSFVVLFEAAVLFYFFKKCKQGIMSTKQIDLKTKSPLLTFFSLSIQGVLPIKVYKQNENFEKEFDFLASNQLRASIYYLVCQRGFGAFINLFTAICNGMGIFLIVYVANSTSDIGQCIIYFVNGIELLQWGMRQLVNLDVAMTNVQRCLNLTKIEHEPSLKTQYDGQLEYKSQDEQVKKFPFEGQLVFKNVKMRYRKDLDLVFKDLSFKILPGKRVGFVGRTGAGKSSIIQALFRITELEYNQGRGDSCDILLDGHSIKNLGLHTLRAGISIIPQSPFIFSGTIRRNLDPLDEYTDETIYEVLRDISLYEKVNQLPKNIYEDMSNASDIFSAGQKQLICLGRAILRKSQLIVLDEATANVDMLTDELIQEKIRQKFKNSTVITIAHRLNTIADYDQIIVMEQGKAVEQGTPYELLQNSNGIFYQMVQHTGAKNALLIKRIAHQKELQKQTQEDI
ncbi:ABC transporter C family protein (macronuclear) [Tetrahymena thermophila SB210]|uniref:ABC transporter C family protein n=1 Tax=Tetrahymena thermophila (strain SB210) TaxID=312017 RepID=Q22TX6_TETTS|nr:ABC transporter C family protein [Tetrahymena thermophila SB210]EAR88911.2 ABC transporter C family protein [Tetrahymena thermophila SB210]|eukprot:XP_001009156.2 ABC transporter C family protein [Tetrahymena thermophila SB210]